MADLKQMSVLDGKLIEDGCIDAAYLDDYPKVHRELNKRARRGAGVLDESHLEAGEKALREWLGVIHRQGAGQEKLTSYLRVGMAHLCYDLIASTYEKIGPEDLITRALLSFKKRKFQKSFFRAAAENRKKIAPVKKKGR